MALKTDGTVWAWGANWVGQLGDGTTTQRLTPVQVLSGVAAVAAGQDHSLALMADGTVRAWGSSSAGELGDGTTAAKHAPVPVAVAPSITTQPASQTVTAGSAAAFTVTATGTTPLSYQWRKDGIDLTDVGNISGAAAATLTIGNARVTDAGSYTCVVSNVAGNVTSAAATLTVAVPVTGVPPQRRGSWAVTRTKPSGRRGASPVRRPQF
jgi:hypothetical protein